jgi:uncharacterized phage-associated protein
MRHIATENETKAETMNEQPIRFRFNAKKAAQAANKLLQLSGGRRNYMELVKLLYLADRKALLRLDCPITGDQLVALPYGPVLSRVLNLIRFGPNSPDDAAWFDIVSPPDGYDVEALGNGDDDELSGAECQILGEVFAEHGNKNWIQLSRLTHKLPEWTDPNGGTIPISPEQILKLEGRRSEEIEHLKRELSLFEQLDRDVSRYGSPEPGIQEESPA